MLYELNTLNIEPVEEMANNSVQTALILPVATGYAQIPDSREMSSDPSQNDEHHEHTATIASSTINLCNTILGTGLLAMPFAVYSVGLVLGALITILSAFASAFGLYLLSTTAREIPERQSSFFTVAERTYPDAAILFDLAVAIKCFGVSVSYLIIFGDLMPQVATSFGISPTSFLANRTLWVTLVIIGMAPLAFKKKLDSLKYASFVALIAVVYFIFVVSQFYFFGDRVTVPKNEIKLFKWSYDIFTNFPVFVFAFTCHQNIFTVHNELKANSSKNVNTIIVSSITICMVIYIWVSTLGYLTFGAKTATNILTLYPQNILISFCRIAVAIFVVSAYPLQSHPARASVGRIVSALKSKFHTREFTPIVHNTPHNEYAAESNTISSTSEKNDASTHSPSNRSQDKGPPESQISTPSPSNCLNPTASRSRSRSGSGSRNPGESAAVNVNSSLHAGTTDTENAQTVNHSNVTYLSILTTANPNESDSQQRIGIESQMNYIDNELSSTLYFRITACLLLTSYIIAIAVTDLGLVLALVGSTGSTSISFILPGILYWKMNSNSNWTLTKAGSIALAAYGVVVMTVCLYVNIVM